MKLLLTAFDPFGGETVNPAQEALRLLPGRIGAAQLVCRTVPTSFGCCAEVLRASIEQERPDAVLCIGQAGGRASLTPERMAVNLDDASIPDNDGDMPCDRPVVPGGPAAYFSTLPIRAMVCAIRAAGIPAEISNTAGTFVCNHLFYSLMHLLHTSYPAVRGGFLHVPYLPEQAAGKTPQPPSMELSRIVCGLSAAIQAIGETGPLS